MRSIDFYNLNQVLVEAFERKGFLIYEAYSNRRYQIRVVDADVLSGCLTYNIIDVVPRRVTIFPGISIPWFKRKAWISRLIFFHDTDERGPSLYVDLYGKSAAIAIVREIVNTAYRSGPSVEIHIKEYPQERLTRHIRKHAPFTRV